MEDVYDDTDIAYPLTITASMSSSVNLTSSSHNLNSTSPEPPVIIDKNKLSVMTEDDAASTASSTFLAPSSDNESYAEMEERLASLQDHTAMELMLRNKASAQAAAAANNKSNSGDSKVDYEAVDRESARTYMSKLAERLPMILECYSANEADEMVQQLASDVCASKSRK